MFYLADETFGHKNQKFTITFGKPIPYTQFDKSKTLGSMGHRSQEHSVQITKSIGTIEINYCKKTISDRFFLVLYLEKSDNI